MPGTRFGAMAGAGDVGIWKDLETRTKWLPQRRFLVEDARRPGSCETVEEVCVVRVPGVDRLEASVSRLSPDDEVGLEHPYLVTTRLCSGFRHVRNEGLGRGAGQ